MQKIHSFSPPQSRSPLKLGQHRLCGEVPEKRTPLFRHRFFSPLAPTPDRFVIHPPFLCGRKNCRISVFTFSRTLFGRRNFIWAQLHCMWTMGEATEVDSDSCKEEVRRIVRKASSLDDLRWINGHTSLGKKLSTLWRACLSYPFFLNTRKNLKTGVESYLQLHVPKIYLQLTTVWGNMYRIVLQ